LFLGHGEVEHDGRRPLTSKWTGSRENNQMEQETPL
jgi:hypothetical protein